MKKIFLLFCFTAVNGFSVDSTIRTVEHFLMELKTTITVDAMICWSHGEDFSLKLYTKLNNSFNSHRWQTETRKIVESAKYFHCNSTDFSTSEWFDSHGHQLQSLTWNAKKCEKILQKNLFFTTEQLYSFHYRIWIVLKSLPPTSSFQRVRRWIFLT